MADASTILLYIFFFLIITLFCCCVILLIFELCAWLHRKYLRRQSNELNEIEMAEPERHTLPARASLPSNLEEVQRIVDEANGDVATCKAFMLACSNGHCNIVERLIASNGINVNHRDTTGTTGLHQCVSRGQLECAKLLVSHGAVLDMQHNGLTPVQQASLAGKEQIVTYFVSLPTCTTAAKVEALELLGTTYIGNVERAVFYWSWSVDERQRAEPGDDVQAKRDQPHPALQGAIEFSTKQELTNFSIDDVMTQSVLIRERVFGPVHRHSSGFIADKAATFARKAKFEKSILLFSYVLDVEQQSGALLDRRPWYEANLDKFCRLTESFTYRMRQGSIVEYQHVLAVLIKLVDVIELTMTPHFKHPWYCTPCVSLLDVLRLISLLAQLQPSISADDTIKFRQVLHKFVHLNVRDDGLTPLHWACYDDTTPYSPLDVVRLLLEAGADPRAVDAYGETPLRTVANNPHHTRPQIIELLLTSGAHFDQRNTHGQCVTDLYVDEKLRIEVRIPDDGET